MNVPHCHPADFSPFDRDNRRYVTGACYQEAADRELGRSGDRYAPLVLVDDSADLTRAQRRMLVRLWDKACAGWSGSSPEEVKTFVVTRHYYPKLDTYAASLFVNIQAGPPGVGVPGKLSSTKVLWTDVSMRIGPRGGLTLLNPATFTKDADGRTRRVRKKGVVRGRAALWTVTYSPRAF